MGVEDDQTWCILTEGRAYILFDCARLLVVLGMLLSPRVSQSASNPSCVVPVHDPTGTAMFQCLGGIKEREIRLERTEIIARAEVLTIQMLT